MFKKALFITLSILTIFQLSMLSFADEWEQDGNKWKYKDTNGDYIRGESKSIDGTWYFFDDDEHMVTGLFDYDDKCYSFDENGKPSQTDITYKGKAYKVNNKGEIKGMSIEEFEDYRDTLSSQFIMGGGYDSDLTDLLNIGLTQAKEYLNTLPLTKKAFKEIFKIKLYNDDAINYMLTSSGINWKQHALKCARELYTTYELDRSKLKTILVSQGFTDAEANYGTEMIFVDTTATKGTEKKDNKTIEKEYLDKMGMAILGEKISKEATTTKTTTETSAASTTQAYDPNTYRINKTSSKFIYLNLTDDDAENGKIRVKVTAPIPTFEGPKATEINALVENSLLNEVFKIASNSYYEPIHRSKKLSFTEIKINGQDATTLALYLYGDFPVYVNIDLATIAFK